MEEFEFLGPNDEPALLAINPGEHLNTVKRVLAELGYKVHAVDSHPQFESRYNQVNYLVIFIDENFAGSNILDNPSLRYIQGLPMAQRRGAVFFLIGPTFESLNSLQAFSQSVHCVINYAELPMLKEVLQKTIADNDLFLNTYREVYRRVYQKGV